MNTDKQPLALLGGNPVIQEPHTEIFRWPIITPEDEQAVLEVLRSGGMSDLHVTRKLEEEYAAWQGTRYALGHTSGTAALHAAMYACGVGVGDEIIGPSIAYWAAVLPALSLGASIVFADVEEETLCIDPGDIEHRITGRTKLIIALHNYGMPARMDEILEIADRHGVKVLEDASHAHGALYRGRKVGGLANAAGMSCMTRKAMAWGEAGMLTTNDRETYERAVAFGHYARHAEELTLPDLSRFAGLPRGGYKYRMNQFCAALGRVQLRHYDNRTAEIQRAMNYFWDRMENLPGVRPHRVAKDSGSTMGGWYAPKGLYRPEELGGLPVETFCEALRAEGVRNCSPGCNFPLHLHPMLHHCDIYGHGRPTVIANSDRDTRQAPGSLPAAERALSRTFSIPWFKRFEPDIIDQYVAAFRKVSLGAERLLERKSVVG